MEKFSETQTMESKLCKVIFNVRFCRFALFDELDIQNGDLQNGVSEKGFFSFFCICPFIRLFVCPSGFCSDGFFQLDHYFFEKNGMVSETHITFYFRDLNFYFFLPPKWCKMGRK